MRIHPSSQKAIDEALKVLQANKDAWVKLSIDERIAILDEIKQDMMKVADSWISASINAMENWENWGQPLKIDITIIVL